MAQECVAGELKVVFKMEKKYALTLFFKNAIYKICQEDSQNIIGEAVKRQNIRHRPSGPKRSACI